jgi:hypothetical protein
MQMQFHLFSLAETEPRMAAQIQVTAKQFALQVEQLGELSAGLDQRGGFGAEDVAAHWQQIYDCMMLCIPATE